VYCGKRAKTPPFGDFFAALNAGAARELVAAGVADAAGTLLAKKKLTAATLDVFTGWQLVTLVGLGAIEKTWE